MIKVSDYIAKRLVELGIRDVFMITGGGAMHLNVSIGRQKGLRCVFNHHEQASAMGAESYARVAGRPAALCVTSGPGGTNAITGVLGAWLDSIPMLVVSGQVKFETTVASAKVPLRQLGDQEYPIIRSVAPMTKYSVMVKDPLDIGYHLDRAFYLAAHGRMGPAWVDVPLNVQAALIDEKKLRRYNPAEDRGILPPAFSRAAALKIIKLIARAKRPVVLVGTGVRLSGAHNEFLKLVSKLNIPVLTAWGAQDAIEDKHPLYFGRPGTIGDRGGNFIIQNCDLLFSIGCRLNIRQIGYNWKTFAREAYKIVVDIDAAELEKPTLSPDMPVHADAAGVCRGLLKALGGKKLPPKRYWLRWCAERRERYPVVLASYWKKRAPVNPYCFVAALCGALRPGDITLTANGMASVAVFHAFKVKKGQRLFANSGCASMGYDLPAAIGAHVASGRRVICVAGDGSIQMNIQELQTIAGCGMPVKIFLFNNNSYYSIRLTQSNFFGGKSVGCGPESGVSLPDMGRLAKAYGLEYLRCSGHDGLAAAIRKTLASPGPALCEIMIDSEQEFAPRVASKKLPGGVMVSTPLEDMAPFLDRREFLENMLIPPLEEKR